METFFNETISFATTAFALFFAIVLHETAHGYVALLCGDETAKKAGRLSLNPLKHIDRTGTLIVPLILLLSKAPLMFGWAKPVPVRFNELKRRKLDMVLVALAGPATNFVLAVVSLIVLGMSLKFIPDFLSVFFQKMILCNISLMLFNLLPVLPLDGGRILEGVLPEKVSRLYARFERWGLAFLVLFLFILPVIGDKIGRDFDFIGMYIRYGLRFLLTGAEQVASFFS